MSRTTLAPDRSAAPDSIPIRPSDRLAEAMPRHAPGVIPVRPGYTAIAIETAARQPVRVLGTEATDDLDALEYSAELL